MNYTFTYEKTSTGDYCLMFTIAHPKVAAFKERFTILAIEKDMTITIACAADSDKPDGFLAESDNVTIAVSQVCSYILNIVATIAANLLKLEHTEQSH